MSDPTPSDMASIEAEWPLIAAELDVVTAECRLALSPVDVLAGRAYRRAVRRLLALLVTGPDPVPASGVAPVAA